jgi:hypothetical protein
LKVSTSSPLPYLPHLLRPLFSFPPSFLSCTPTSPVPPIPLTLTLSLFRSLNIKTSPFQPLLSHSSSSLSEKPEIGETLSHSPFPLSLLEAERSPNIVALSGSPSYSRLLSLVKRSPLRKTLPPLSLLSFPSFSPLSPLPPLSLILSFRSRARRSPPRRRNARGRHKRRSPLHPLLPPHGRAQSRENQSQHHVFPATPGKLQF